MGGCATKPRTLKGEDDLAPEPIPATDKEFSEAKEVAVDGEEAKVTSHEGEEEKVIDKAEVGDGKGEDDVKTEDIGNKPRSPRSLSNLFKESEAEKESSGNAETESVKQEKEPETKTETKTETETETIIKEVGTRVPEAEETTTTPEAEVKSVLPIAAEKNEKEEEKRTEEVKGVAANNV